MRTYVFIQAAQTLASAAGRTYTLPNEAPAMMGCVHIVLVTTATAGNRTPIMRILDATGNVLFEGQSTLVGPSLTNRMNWGAGMISGSQGNYTFNGIPDMMIPPISQVNIFDATNIDPNDTIATSVTMADPR